MSVFFGTLVIVGLSCLAMALGQMIDGKPLAGGCGGNPKDKLRCASCPKRKMECETEEKS